ncbi:MAG: BMP family ABC transporter substrate-binding protein [Candidatus Kariarchaeaceae archaeon]|jgi:basic membrane lipoprotein Med (substrate-binding protein (PBP1-ABC) superfamily)
MKKQIIILLFISLILFGSQPININNASVQVPLEKIAIIIDSPEFYHSSFVDGILQGFNVINTTFQIDFDIFHLSNYSVVGTDPYQFAYTYNDTVTNHSQIVENNKDNYDLFVIIGYELRRNFLNFSEYEDNNFLFYDLSGEYPAFSTSEVPSNLYIVSFQDHEEAFLAGSLAVAKYYPLPPKIAIVGTFRSDPRSKRLIAGYQSALFRNSTNKDILISYVDDWVNRAEVQRIGTDLSNQGYSLVFSALQANNTLELDKAFTKGPVVCVDLNITPSVMKNNSYVLFDVFNSFNASGGYFGGVVVTYGLSDDIFYGYGWDNPSLVNKTITELKEDISSKDLVIPFDIVTASNTPGYSFIILILSITSLMIVKKKPNKNS